MKFQQLIFRVVRVANYDFCPSLNGLTDLLKQPLGWVVSAIVFSLLVGFLVGPQGYVLAFVFLALLVLGLAWPWLSMKGVRCRLVLPDRRVEENQELEVVLRVKNFWPLPIFGLMVKGDFLQDGEGDESVAFSLKRVATWSESEFRVPVTPRRRGRLPNGRIAVANGFPFGLMDIAKTVEEAQPTLVWPTCVALDGFPVSDSTRFCLQGALLDKAGNDGDSIGVRAYRSGDRLRNIHWAQLARSQKLVVRERQSIAPAGATVFLDLTPSTHEGRGADSSFEWTIRIAASICNHLHESRSPVRVVAFGLVGQAQLHEDNRNGIRPIMDFLANLPSLTNALKQSEFPGKEKGATDSCLNTNDGHLFVIGSSQSTQIQSIDSRDRTSSVTPVVVDMDGFKNKSESLSHTQTTASLPKPESRKRDHDPIAINTPQSAAKELVSGWDRSFSDSN